MRITIYLVLMLSAVSLNACYHHSYREAAPEYVYWGGHPTPDGGWCSASGSHSHHYLLDDEQYIVHDQHYVFVGDPTYYGYVDNDSLYYYDGVHPYPYADAWCPIQGPHYHVYGPHDVYSTTYVDVTHHHYHHSYRGHDTHRVRVISKSGDRHGRTASGGSVHAPATGTVHAPAAGGGTVAAPAPSGGTVAAPTPSEGDSGATSSDEPVRIQLSESAGRRGAKAAQASDATAAQTVSRPSKSDALSDTSSTRTDRSAVSSKRGSSSQPVSVGRESKRDASKVTVSRSKSSAKKTETTKSGASRAKKSE
ncbi:MAG: hypothetical protein RBU37_21525, partial [Myxococcota bacterium]|nr:hypothetical protein [Myxococcota bacterium]